MTVSPRLLEQQAINPKFNLQDAVEVAMEAEVVAHKDLSVVIELAFDDLQDVIDTISDGEGASGQDIIDAIEKVQMAIGEFSVLK